MSCLEIQNKLNETWEYCKSLYGIDRMVSLTLHGSQNYECDLPESDVDAKLFITPTWDEVVYCKQPLSKTIQGPHGDINVTDIRLFIGSNLRKQNFNFLECLFTPYSCVNSAYADLWDKLTTYREEIAHYDPQAAIRTMMGQVENQWRRWNKFDNKKTLYHMMRINGAIERYMQGYFFADTLIPENQPHIMQVRLGRVSEENMEHMFNMFYEHAHYLTEETEYKGAQYECTRFLEDIQREFIYRALYELRIEE